MNEQQGSGHQEVEPKMTAFWSIYSRLAVSLTFVEIHLGGLHELTQATTAITHHYMSGYVMLYCEHTWWLEDDTSTISHKMAGHVYARIVTKKQHQTK